MSKHVIHVKSCHSCQIMAFMSNHVIHVKSCHSCQIMSFMSNLVIHVKSCHSCQIISSMSNHVIHVKSCHSRQIMSNHAMLFCAMRSMTSVGEVTAEEGREKFLCTQQGNRTVNLSLMRRGWYHKTIASAIVKRV
jgi:ribosomal protein L18